MSKELEDILDEAFKQVEHKLFRYGRGGSVKHGLNVTDAKTIIRRALKQAQSGKAIQSLVTQDRRDVINKVRGELSDTTHWGLETEVWFAIDGMLATMDHELEKGVKYGRE